MQGALRLSVAQLQTVQQASAAFAQQQARLQQERQVLLHGVSATLCHQPGSSPALTAT